MEREFGVPEGRGRIGRLVVLECLGWGEGDLEGRDRGGKGWFLERFWVEFGEMFSVVLMLILQSVSK